MFTTKLPSATPAFQRHEVDKIAEPSGALMYNGKESSRRFGGRENGDDIRVRMNQKNARVNLCVPGPT